MVASRTQLPLLAPMLETGPAAVVRVLATRALLLGLTSSTSGTTYRTQSEVCRPPSGCLTHVLTSSVAKQVSQSPDSAQDALSAQQADAGYKPTPGYTYNYQRMKWMSRVEPAANVSRRDVIDSLTGNENDGQSSSDDNSSACSSCVGLVLHADVPL